MYIKSTLWLTEISDEVYYEASVYRIPCKTDCYINGKESKFNSGYPSVTVEGYFEVAWPIVKQLQSNHRWKDIQTEIEIKNNPALTDLEIHDLTREWHQVYVKAITREINYIEEVLDIGGTLTDLKRKPRIAG